MSPDQLAVNGTEAGHQTALFCWAALNMERFPELRWLHHIPNGGSRGSNKRHAQIVGGQLKAQGVKSGVSDICLPVKRGVWSGLYIELKKLSEKPVKAASRGGVSDDQREFGLFVQSQGFGFAVCYGWNEAAQTIESYLARGQHASHEPSNAKGRATG